MAEKFRQFERYSQSVISNFRHRLTDVIQYPSTLDLHCLSNSTISVCVVFGCYGCILTQLGFYINGLALQAVLEKWTTKVGSEFEDSSPKTPGSSVSSSFASLYSQNEYYIKQVVDAARTVLRHVVDGLLPDDYLKHASVRIYFRIVSAAMFLLKVSLACQKTTHWLNDNIDVCSRRQRGRSEDLPYPPRQYNQSTPNQRRRRRPSLPSYCRSP